ncbi:RNB domain-containing ribonuclease [Streptomyces sp. NPDC053079]|uniref:RNB domain-containing ribonuclease n=1 Tax=Streptomyces sp. NPDC053079 TaxID=3365697 RepID=UPI0037D21355
MPRRPIHVTDTERTPLLAALRALRERTHVPERFPERVLQEAEEAVRRPRMPAYDATDVPFFTIDPPGSKDLDQAMFLARRRGGYRVHYAIADVGAFLLPGGALDEEAHSRVMTLYYPDVRIPLYPESLGEGAASLLPDYDRPAVLWRLDLDTDGQVVATDVRRAVVRSRARLEYAGVQRVIDAGTAEEPLSLLREIGMRREELERTRGGISLNVPEQEVVRRGDGHYALAYRVPLPADGWNAQISLMTGMAAARLMLGAGTGVLRTLPAAPEGAVERLRRVAKALGVAWPAEMPYAVVVRALDPKNPQHAAFLQECTTLLRGAGYAAFDRDRPTTLPAPADPGHAALAAPYAHCTAPLRRLVDRYTSELCVAAAAGLAAPEWVRAALDELPGEMERGARRAGEAERECVDLVEAALMRDRIGQVFDAYVVDVVESRPTAGTVHLYDPAVVGHVEGDGDGPPLPLGKRMRVRAIQANPGREKVWFAPA